MSTLTKDQWAEVERNLKGMFGSVSLKCDGHLIYCNRGNTAEGRFEIAVYIDGFIDFKHMSKGRSEQDLHETFRKFWRVKKSGVHNPSKAVALERKYGKRLAKKYGVHDKIYQLTPFWPKAAGLCRHLRKHNENVELISYDDMRAELGRIKAKEAEASTNA